VSAPRIRAAFFTDSFHDVNGVAHTSRHLDAFARRRGYPLLNVHAGHPTKEFHDGSVYTVEIGRSRNRVPLDDGLAFDPWFLRYWGRCWDAVGRFKPNVIHITGPGDVGILGTLIAWRRGIPLVASWHTNLHEYAGRRWFFDSGRQRVQDTSWTLLMQFYRIAKVCLAPNEELRSMVATHTHRPSYLMERGIDTELFHPSRRSRQNSSGIVLGYVGRLRPEKNVRALQQVEAALIAAGLTNYRFLIVGDGSEREWLQQNLRRADFAGVRKGEELAAAYADMDLFLFPSWTDTYGNVVAEALASAVPAVVTTGGGPKFLVRDGVTGVSAGSDEAFAQRVVDLVRSPERIDPMRLAAREWALGKSWDAVFEKVWLCYEQAAGVSMSPCPKPFATAC
jgi:glycosyltransferase involved in cell wall biosynthesis